MPTVGIHKWRDQRIGQRALSVAAPSIYGTLPPSLRLIDSHSLLYFADNWKDICLIRRSIDMTIYSVTFLGRLSKVDLIILEGEKRPSVRTSVRTSVRPSTKSFFDFNEIWYIGRGRWVMHDGMPYGRNQGQGQGHSREVDRQSPTGLIFRLCYSRLI